MRFVFLSWLFVAAAGTSAQGQPVAARHGVFAEIGGASASVSINYERALVSVITARAGVGSFPMLGVQAAVPATVRVSVGDKAFSLDAGAGVLLAWLSSEFLFSWATDAESPSLQLFPSIESGAQLGLGDRYSMRVGLALLYDSHDTPPEYVLLPSLGLKYDL